MKQILFSLIALTLFISCNPDNAEPQIAKDYTAENEKQITDYLTEKNLTAQRTESGLYYIISEEGTGKQATATSTITVTYKGYLINGTIFDQSKDGVSTFLLKGLIQGWIEGIPYFKEGGSGVLLIPAHLAYGGYNNGIIKAGSVVIFDIKLISVN